MKYRDILGFSKPKKKIIKEQPKQKKTVLDGIKKDILNEWHHSPPTEKRWSKNTTDTGLTEFEQNGGKDIIKEVGAGTEYRPHIMKIDKLYHAYWDAVKDFTDLLLKKGAKKEANTLHKLYMKLVHKFHKTHFIKMIRKLM